MTLGLSGFILLDKPVGPTSHDLVMTVRRGTGIAAVGHTGTLDPLATGLLVVALGFATRLSDYLRNKDKRYTARVRLGQTTTTYDAEGPLTAESPHLPERAAVEAALLKFHGVLLQRPPAYSAIKRDGQKAYALARAGQVLDLPPRHVEIYALRLTAWEPPHCTLEVHCAPGTYIRSLAHDLGQALGCGAHLAALRRTASGQLSVETAVTLPDFKTALSQGVWQQHLRPPEIAVADWPAVHLSPTETERLRHGQPVPLTAAPGDYARGYNAAGEFCALLRADPAAQLWRPFKVFAPRSQA